MRIPSSLAINVAAAELARKALAQTSSQKASTLITPSSACLNGEGNTQSKDINPKPKH